MSGSEVRAAVERAFRDFETDGVPASGDHEPVKSDIRHALGPLLETALVNADAGILRYATVAAMNANAAAPDGQLAYVYRNAGSVTDAANGYYQSVGGVWSRAEWFEGNLSPTLLGIIPASSGRNQFDKLNIVVGYEVYYTDGHLEAIANSAVSNLIYVRNWDAVTISGLFDNVLFARYYAWLAGDGETVVDFGFFNAALEEVTLAKPADAVFFHFDVYKRNDAPGSLDAIQVESGTVATGYEAFRDDLIVGLDGRTLNVERVVIGTVGTKNLFNKATVTEGKEVYYTGDLVDQPQSSYSAPIYVGHLQGRAIHISGFQASPFAKYYSFYSNDTIEAANKVAGSLIPAENDEATLIVPIGGNFLVFSPKQRNPDAPDYDALQVEVGDAATAYEPFTPRVGTINGMRVGDKPVPLTAAQGGIGLGFGDSITETTNVNAGSYLYPDGYRQNWPDVAVPLIAPEAYYSFAKSGAAIIDWAVADGNFQKLSHQVDTAIAADHNARWIVVAIGTNDIGNGNPLGDYATAMAKALRVSPTGVVTTTLDSSIVLEAFRRELFRLNWKWPNARKFFVTPLQRADVSPDAMSAAVEALARMARRYNFEVVDAFNESGILAELEGGDITASIAGNTLTVTNVAASIPLKVGQQVRGAGVLTTTITALGTGTGGNGTYTVADAQAVSARTMQIAGGNKTYDGLHTYTQGWNDQGSLIAARVKARFG